MKEGLLWKLALQFTSLSLVAIGGANAVVPEMRRQLVDQTHWLSESEFVHLFAVAQVAPGPNISVLSLIGWRLGGFAGFLVATIAAIAPTCLIAWGMARFVARHGQAAWFETVKQGLAPVAIGLVAASGLVMARAADHDRLTIAASAATAALIVFTKINPLWALGGFAALAVCFYSP